MVKYPKFNKQEDCAYPEREICNWDDRPESKRCEYMKCRSMGNWYCKFKKEENK